MRSLRAAPRKLKVLEKGFSTLPIRSSSSCVDKIAAAVLSFIDDRAFDRVYPYLLKSDSTTADEIIIPAINGVSIMENMYM